VNVCVCESRNVYTVCECVCVCVCERVEMYVCMWKQENVCVRESRNVCERGMCVYVRVEMYVCTVCERRMYVWDIFNTLNNLSLKWYIGARCWFIINKRIFPKN